MKKDPPVAGQTFRWHAYVRVLKARGLIKNFSRGETQGRARRWLEEDIKMGRVKQIKFGHPVAEYELL
jgi:hypothetical protein